jgi:hypothetical protein
MRKRCGQSRADPAATMDQLLEAALVRRNYKSRRWQADGFLKRM